MNGFFGHGVRGALALLAGLAVAGCAQDAPAPSAGPDLDEIAEGYVRAVLALGEHDPGYVDAYYGPEAWQDEAASAGDTLEAIERRAEELRAAVATAAASGADADDPLLALRRTYLERQLAAVVARAQMLAGARWSFDEESRALYDAVAPQQDLASFEAIAETMGARLAEEGFVEGSTIERYQAYRSAFAVPTERLDAVFRAAIEACRERTLEHLELPAEESFTLEYVTDQPWSGYNWYQGEYRSLIQVNTDLPVYIDRALDLACHEGYPGHHVYNALLEKHLARDRGWVEVTIYPLYSPQSLIAEGTASFGVEMAFPGSEQLAFEREVLYPLAGLDPERAAVYAEIQVLVERLSRAGNDAARAYLDGEIDAETAAAWLSRYAALPPARAAQRVEFFDAYRSYVINYTLGRDLVRAWIERRAGDDPEARWQAFGELLSSPRLPSGLRE